MRIHQHVGLACLFATAHLWAQAPAKAVPFALEKVLSLPLQVQDSQVTLDRIGEVTVVSPDFFVFLGHANVASPGAFNNGWGCFSWKAGSLKTVLLDVKTFKSLYGELPEKSNLDPERSTLIARNGLLYFTVSQGWAGTTPADLRGWAGGLYTWDGGRIQKVLGVGDTATLRGESGSVKAVNLLAVQPDETCLVFLRVNKQAGLVLIRKGVITPILVEKEPIPGLGEVTLSEIRTLLGVPAQGDAVFALLEPRKGEPFVAQIKVGSCARILTLRDPDPTESGNIPYHVTQGDAADADALALWVYSYRGGKVDRRGAKLLLWDHGTFQTLYRSTEEVWAVGPQDTHEEALPGLWWTQPSKRQFVAILRKRLDGQTVQQRLIYFDGARVNEVASEGHLPNQFPKARLVPGGEGALTLTGVFADRPPYGQWQAVKALFEPRAPYQLGRGPLLTSSNHINFLLASVLGGDPQTNRFVVQLPDGFYVSR